MSVRLSTGRDRMWAIFDVSWIYATWHIYADDGTKWRREIDEVAPHESKREISSLYCSSQLFIKLTNITASAEELADAVERESG
jgi:hypothetical protein